MLYSVQAFGVVYAKFVQEVDALDYAKSKSVLYISGWFEVLKDDRHYIAYQAGQLVGPNKETF